ncbi:MAG: S-layer homology domain-containing protein [Candidatus Peribacteraceae bacterium]|nr:S-layer homology domain-containing protein [Candidatus Peribacteraceae bacterium]MDD5742866.1 S-layer homology domain-containing protein [Candidatus Peribacteraceae bacterium]
MWKLRWIVSLAIVAMGFIPYAAAASAFSDVPDTHPYAEAIELLRQREIVQGFIIPGEYHVFWPDASVTRAEFVKMIVQALAPQVLIDGCLEDASSLQKYGLGMQFSDVAPDAWFAPPVCVAWSYRFISGYGDGSFKPDRPITLAEASKILAIAFRLAPIEIPDLALLGTEWYKPYLHYMETAGAIPPTAQDYAHLLTRGEVAEMLARLLKLPSELPPVQRIALDEVEVANPVTWTETQNDTLGYALSYPDSWPAPHLVSRNTYDGTILPKLPAPWRLFVGTQRKCLGGSMCIERDFSLTGFDHDHAADALDALRADPDVKILSDEIVDHTWTVLFEEATPNCTVRSAFIMTPKRFVRFTLHCGSSLHNPETAYMRMLGKLKILEN